MASLPVLLWSFCETVTLSFPGCRRIVLSCVINVTVTALDLDSGVNAELEYSVDSEFFYVETVKRDAFTYSGIIKVKK